jgi:hypothetical protein
VVKTADLFGSYDEAEREKQDEEFDEFEGKVGHCNAAHLEIKV